MRERQGGNELVFNLHTHIETSTHCTFHTSHTYGDLHPLDVGAYALHMDDAWPPSTHLI